MNRIEPSGPGKPGFDVPALPTPIQNRALRLLNAEQLYLEVVEIRVESRRDRVVECWLGFCIFEAAPGPIRPLPMMNPDGVPDFCLFGSFARFSFAAARRAWKACGQSFPSLSAVPRSGAWIAHIPTAPSGLGARAAIRHPAFGVQGWRDLHKALAITTSLRATAVTTTLCGFPSFRSRSANSFKSVL